MCICMSVLQGAGPMGGGDALMSLLGLVIISFGFRVYTQRETMKRHFPEIVGATILSSIFSLFSTAFAAKAIGLSAGGCQAGLLLRVDYTGPGPLRFGGYRIAVKTQQAVLAG